jgi:two-component system sensor histidine kinase RegB
VNYAFTAALLAFFVAKIRLGLQQHGRLLAEVHDRQMRNESTVAIGSLAASCAHEMSSPLATVAVVVGELQREHAGNPKLQESLKLIGGQLEVTKQALSNLTAAAGERRAEAAGVARLDCFLTTIVQQAQVLYPETTIRSRIGDGPAPRIVAEETLRQAFANLIDNAVRASPEYVEVTAGWSGPNVVVVVCDRGPGFPQEILGKLCKAESAKKRLEAGVGVGLILTTVTLGRLGGSLTLENIAHGGARAEVRLPLRAILLEDNRAVPQRGFDE